MNQSLVILSLALLVSTNAFAQWEPQKSGTTANLRGLHAVSDSVAWAGGSEGTVLRTEDGGVRWQSCATPSGAEKLDFRGVWAWDAKTAMVLSSGPGEQSRVYETKDGCSHWTEMIRNSDKDGFWDAMTFQAGDFGMSGDERTGVLIGDPLHNRFYTMTMIFGHGWFNDDASCAARPGEAAFAASDTSAFVFGSRRYILVTGGIAGTRALLSAIACGPRRWLQGCFGCSSSFSVGRGVDRRFLGFLQRRSTRCNGRRRPLNCLSKPQALRRLRPTAGIIGPRRDQAAAWPIARRSHGMPRVKSGLRRERMAPISRATAEKPGNRWTMEIGTRCRCPTLWDPREVLRSCVRMRSASNSAYRKSITQTTA